ncbi:MAG: MmgE/PrpD family protein [Pseudomonadota bacterium]
MNDTTRTLARFAADVRFDQLGRGLVGKFKKHLLDAIGCGIHGTSQPWARIVNQYIREQRGKRESTLWLQSFRGPAANVALGLGVMIHSFDFDDYHNAKIHPGAPVIPAAVAVGEEIGASGRDVLAAMVAGYETMIRVSLATGPNASRLKGWHLTGTTGTFGAAAAAGNLLRLNEDQMASALGMAGTQSAGLWAFTADGAMSKRFHPGRASQSGVMAALLARKGFKGPTQILEAADGGFCKATSDQVDLSLITTELGTRFLCRDVNIKPYACCASSHSAIDAVFELRKGHRFAPSDVEKILVKTAEGVKLQCGFEYRAMGVVQAQMSLQYIVAVSLLDGAAMLEQFSDTRISEPQVMALAGRVEVVMDPEMDELYPGRYANKVEIFLKDGQRFEARIDFARGSAESPMDFSEVAGKFRSLAGPVIAGDRVERLAETVERLEMLDDIRELTCLLA